MLKGSDSEINNKVATSIQNLVKCQLCNATINDPTTIMDCSHTFCSKCINEHLHKESSCPICKKPVVPRRGLRKHCVLKRLIEEAFPSKDSIDLEEGPLKKKMKPSESYMVILGCEIEKKFDFNPIKLSMKGSTPIVVLQKFLSAKVTKTICNHQKITLCYVKNGKKEVVKTEDTIDKIFEKAKTNTGNIFLFFNIM